MFFIFFHRIVINVRRLFTVTLRTEKPLLLRFSSKGFEVDKPKQCMPKANIYRKTSNIYLDCIKHKIDVVIIILRKGHLM